MVRVLCYGHKGYKFDSCSRLTVIKQLLKGYAVDGFTF